MTQSQPNSWSNRRVFLRRLGAAAAAVATATTAAEAATTDNHGGKVHLATNQYPWFTFYRRQGRNFNASLDAALGEVAAAGLDGFEPLATSPEQLQQLIPLLKKHGLQMRSLYVNSVLHEPEQVEKSIETVLAIADLAKQAGARIIVTNPSPIRWGGPENKTDEQLIFQAKSLDRLGALLRERGMVLSYHNHDIELRNAAREFHHMMLATEPGNVTLCLDAHWIYRGAGNSSVALFDVVKLYGKRITELHLRQSAGGVWTETFTDGDIDYRRLAAELLALGVKPHLVVEQAVEKDSPNTLSAVEAHRRSCRYAREVFAQFASS